MQSLKSVLSRKDEQENLRNFLLSLSLVVVLVVSFFGFHAVSFLIQSEPDYSGHGQIASVEAEPYENVE